MPVPISCDYKGHKRDVLSIGGTATATFQYLNDMPVPNTFQSK